MAGGTISALAEDMKQSVLLTLALCLSFTFARNAHAEDDEELVPLNAPLTVESPRLGLALTLGGFAGAATGMVLVVAPALALELRCEGADLCGISTAIYITATAWATPATTALGIWAAGRAAGGRGNYGITLLGAAIGGTAGVGVGVLAAFASEDAAIFVGLISIPILEWVGGAIAYKLSHDANQRSSERRIMPSVQVERGGASLMLSGAF
jgi:hypothetical protein